MARFVCPPHSSVIGPFRKNSADCLEPGEIFERKQMQLWRNLFPKPLEWRDNRREKRSPSHPDFRHRSKEPLCLSNQQEPVRISLWIRTVDAQLRTGLGVSVNVGSELEGLCQEGQLDRAIDLLDQQDCVPSVSLYGFLLEACAKWKALTQVKRVQAHLSKQGFEPTGCVGELLVSTLVKCGSLRDALDFFHRLPRRTAMSWTAVISGCTLNGHHQQALIMYETMKEEGVQPNTYTFVSLLKSCGSTSDLSGGKRMHSDVLMYRCGSDMFVTTALVNMYGKCGNLVDARAVFDAAPFRNVVMWNAMAAAYAQHGQPETTLLLYEQMQKEGVSPNARTYVSTFQACGILAETEVGVLVNGMLTKVNCLAQGQEIHADSKKKGYDRDVFVGNTLIIMYGRCGSISLARNVFDRLTNRDIISWTALLAVYAQQEQPLVVLQLYEELWKDGLRPDNRTFVRALQACSMLAERVGDIFVHGQSCTEKYLERGKAIHAHARRMGCDCDVSVGSALITMYGKFGRLTDAKNVFDGLETRSAVPWTAILSAHTQHGHGLIALELYEKMREEGVSPDKCTLVSAIKACSAIPEEDLEVNGPVAGLNALERGKVLHADVLSKGFGADVVVGNALITMYGKCGSIRDAETVFDGLSQRDLVSWTAILVAYTQHGELEKVWQLYKQMREEGLSPDRKTFLSLCQVCGTLAEEEDEFLMDGQPVKIKLLQKAKELHAEADRKKVINDILVGNSLVQMFSKCGCLPDAENVFDGFCQWDLVSWTEMLAGYVRMGKAEKALQLYEQMQDQGLTPDGRTMVSALQACGAMAEREEAVVVHGSSVKLKSLQIGKIIHAHAHSVRHNVSSFVGGALISMYGRCGCIADAQNVFEGLTNRDLVLCNLMLAAYFDVGQAGKSLQLYEEMVREQMYSDSRTILVALQSCGKLAEQEEETVLQGQPTKVRSLEAGKAIHATAHKMGIDLNVFIHSALISLYGKCGSIVDAESVFEGFSQSDVVTWNTMLGVLTQQGEFEKAFQLFNRMELECIYPSEVTLVCVLQAAGRIGCIDRCRQIHYKILSSEVHLSPALTATLIHAYGKCASMKDAHMVFDALLQPDVIAWTALIAGYARLGNHVASGHYFKQMQLSGTRPNGVTFLSLLSACSHAGLVEGGLECFESMSRDYDITPGIEHYVSLVDLLGRAGHFNKVKAILSTMPVQPNLSMWLCLLGACRKHGDVILGKMAFDKARGLQPKDAAAYVLMSNLYSRSGQLDCAEKILELEQEAGARKKPGQCWIEEKGGLHSFFVEDCRHPQQKHFYDLLGKLSLALDAHNGRP